MKIGLVIVVVALFGAVLAGSIGVGEETRTAESFDRVTDLAPIVSYSPVEEELLYNPAQNITGWEGVTYTYQTAPSLYPFIETSTSATVSYSLANLPGAYYASDAATYIPEFGIWWSYANGTTANGWEAQPIMNGGYSASASGPSYYANTVVSLYHADTGVTEGATSDTPIYWISLDERAMTEGWATGTVISVAATADSGIRSYIYQDLEFNGSRTVNTGFGNALGILKLTVSDTDGGDYYWSAETNSWYVISGFSPTSGIPIVTNTAHKLVLVSDSTDFGSINLTTYTAGSTQYVKPYTEVAVNNTTTGGVWQNGYTNTSIELIVQPEATITSGTFSWTLPSSSSTYVRCLVHIDPNGESYWQGITRYEGPSDYDIVDYKFALSRNATVETVQVTLTDESESWTFNFPVGSEIVIEAATNGEFNPGATAWRITGSEMEFHMVTNAPHLRTYYISGTVTEDTTVTVMPYIVDSVWTFNVLVATAVINSVTVTDSPTAYVLNTWMPRDAEGLLWGNPSFNAAEYFPNLMPLRVQINAAVLTGDTLTVNGSTMAVTDNSLELAVDGGTVLVPISGMGIEWRADGNTYIVAADGTSYSLGTTTSTAVSGTGSWYLSGEVQQITTTTATVLVPIYADAPTLEWSIFAFIGLCIGGAVVMLAVGRSSLAVTDWAIIIGAAIIGVMLL